MMKFNINDKVKLAHPDNILNFDDYGVEWKEFWYNNSNTIFIISSIIDSGSHYILKYPNNENVMNPISSMYYNIAIFAVDELVPYITTNPLPDELFKL